MRDRRNYLNVGTFLVLVLYSTCTEYKYTKYSSFEWNIIFIQMKQHFHWNETTKLHSIFSFESTFSFKHFHSNETKFSFEWNNIFIRMKQLWNISFIRIFSFITTFLFEHFSFEWNNILIWMKQHFLSNGTTSSFKLPF
jgi:hypothetical protein